MYLGTDFFGFIPVFTHLLKYRGLCFCLFVCFCRICKVFSHNFFESIFRPFLFLLFFQNLNDMDDRIFCCYYGPPGAWHQSCFFFFFLKSVLSLLFILGNFCCSYLRFTDSFLCYLHSAVEATQWVLICIFICYSLLRLSAFSCVQCAYWNSFMITALKSLS